MAQLNGVRSAISRNRVLRLTTPDGDLHPSLSGFFERYPVGSHWNNEQILREEIFSIERLEEHARSLAAAQQRHASARLSAARSARACATTKRSCSRRTARSRRRWTKAAHHAGRRVAARQLPRRRGADPRDPRGPAAGLLPPAAEARGRPVRGIPARVRHRLGIRRAHRQPLRSGDAAPLRARLPERAAADHRRVVGGGDHAAHRAGREPAARRAAHRRQPRGARRKPTRSPTGCSASTASRAEPDALIACAAARRRRTLPRVRRAARAAAARSGSDGHAGAGVARERLAAQGTDGRRHRAAKSTSARAPRTSPCATSSPACGSCPTSTGRSSSRA